MSHHKVFQCNMCRKEKTNQSTSIVLFLYEITSQLIAIKANKKRRGVNKAAGPRINHAVDDSARVKKKKSGAFDLARNLKNNNQDSSVYNRK